jgi:hypothetical protein
MRKVNSERRASTVDDESFYKLFMQELDKILQANSFVDRSKAQIYWFAKNCLGIDDDDEIKTRITDGPNDEGIDGIFVDDDGVIWVVNASVVNAFDHTSRHLPETELKIAFEGFRLITVGDYRGKVNPFLRDLLKEYHELQETGASVKFVFVHLNEKPSSMTYVTQFNSEFPNVPVSFFDFEELKKAYESYLISQEKAPSTVSIEIVDGGREGAILANDAGIRARVFTVSAKTLANLLLTYSTTIFQRNVRYFIRGRGKQSINLQIQATASDPAESKYFWYYNNGVTIVCSHFEIPPNQRVAILNRMQVINGAQTTYSVLEAYSKGELQDDTRILVRLIESTDDDFIDSVTLYTNSQNPVNVRDLASVQTNQVRIQNILKISGYFYERKRGEFEARYLTDAIREKDFGPDWRSKVIPNDRASQAYLAMFLDKPAQAKTRKRRIFILGEGGFFNDIFNDRLIPEQLLLAYKLLRFIESKTKEYLKQYYSARELGKIKESEEIYRYDFLLHSDFFVLSLFADFLGRAGIKFDKESCVETIGKLERPDESIVRIYNEIKDLLSGYVAVKRQEDETYSNTKFFKSEATMGLIRDYLRKEKKLSFVHPAT